MRFAVRPAAVRSRHRAVNHRLRPGRQPSGGALRLPPGVPDHAVTGVKVGQVLNDGLLDVVLVDVVGIVGNLGAVGGVRWAIQSRSSRCTRAYAVTCSAAQASLNRRYSAAAIFVDTVCMLALSHFACRLLSTSCTSFPTLYCRPLRLSRFLVIERLQCQDS